jgi:HAMP domain-containing protein
MKNSDTERRRGQDRRNQSARRRYAENRRIAIELGQSVLRVAIVVDSEKESLPSLRARTIRWRHEAPNLICDQGRAEITAALRGLVNEERLAGCHVSLAISSTLCVNRATTGATARVEQEITEVRERSQLYLSLGPGPKVTATARKPIDARHEHALVTVTNQRTLALLVEAAQSAGLVVDVVESALVSLSRLHGVLEAENNTAAVLAQLDEGRFEIGVSRGGQLLLEYRPSSDSKTNCLGAVVDDHHDRLRRFCQRQYGATPGDLDRMWLVGEPAEVAAAEAKTQIGLETGVLPMTRVPELWRLESGGEVTAEMGAALGLALRGRFTEQGVSPNLMDEILAQAKEPIRPFLIRAAAPLAAALLMAAGLWLYNLQQQSQLAALRTRVEAAKPDHLRGQRLSRELADAATEIEQLSQLKANMPQRMVSPLIQGVGFCLPDDVWLRELKFDDRGNATVIGASYTEGSVYDFVRFLEEAPTFHDVALRGTGLEQTPQGPATSFGVDLKAAPAETAREGVE